jgi:hypothetical protein
VSTQRPRDAAKQYLLENGPAERTEMPQVQTRSRAEHSVRRFSGSTPANRGRGPTVYYLDSHDLRDVMRAWADASEFHPGATRADVTRGLSDPHQAAWLDVADEYIDTRGTNNGGRHEAYGDCPLCGQPCTTLAEHLPGCDG